MQATHRAEGLNRALIEARHTEADFRGSKLFLALCSSEMHLIKRNWAGGEVFSIGDVVEVQYKETKRYAPPKHDAWRSPVLKTVEKWCVLLLSSLPSALLSRHLSSRSVLARRLVIFVDAFFKP